jgi:hypothetical protein
MCKAEWVTWLIAAVVLGLLAAWWLWKHVIAV